MRFTAICLAVTAACGGGQHSGPVSNQTKQADHPIGDDPLAVLPIDSEVVFHLDIPRLRASATWQQIEPKLMAQGGPMLTGAKPPCGSELIAGIKSVSAGLRGVGDPTPTGVFVVRGMERGRGMGCYEQHRANSKNKIVIEGDIVSETMQNGQVGSFTFVDGSTMVLALGATPADLKRVVASGVPLKTSPAFGQLIGAVHTTDPAWFMINGNAHFLDQAAALGVKPKAVLGSVDLATGLTGNVRIRLETADQAQQLAAMANGQIGMAKNFFDKLDVKSDQTDFVVDAKMTQAQVDTVMQMLAGSFSSGVNPGP